MSDIESKVYEALGAASVCWTPEGVFDSDRAKSIGEDLMHRIVQEVEQARDDEREHIAAVAARLVEVICQQDILLREWVAERKRLEAWQKRWRIAREDAEAARDHYLHQRDTARYEVDALRRLVDGPRQGVARAAEAKVLADLRAQVEALHDGLRWNDGEDALIYRSQVLALLDEEEQP